MKEVIKESTQRSIIVQGVDGRDFEARYIPKGGRYGRNNSLVAKNNLVEFWDMKHNQFVSRYDFDTIFNVDGGVPEWSIPAREMDKVIDWLGDIEVYDVYGVKENTETLTVDREVQVNEEIILEEGDTIQVVKQESGANLGNNFVDTSLFKLTGHTLVKDNIGFLSGICKTFDVDDIYRILQDVGASAVFASNGSEAWDYYTTEMWDYKGIRLDHFDFIRSYHFLRQEDVIIEEQDI